MVANSAAVGVAPNSPTLLLDGATPVAPPSVVDQSVEALMVVVTVLKMLAA
jgi:hypothetical protein